VIASLRKGWCPGALRPMETGDGLLVRLRLTGGILSIRNAMAIGHCANRHGNGLIELSNRANLQLRGVKAETLEQLSAEFYELGIIDANAAAESVRNVIASPLAGIDPDAMLDIRPVIKALEAELVGNIELHSLPGKFGFVVDDGGRLSLAEVPTDVRFEAFDGSQRPRFAICLAGAEDAWIGECEAEDVPRYASTLARAFLALRGDGADAPHRMRDLVRRTGPEVVAEAAGLNAGCLQPRSQRKLSLREVLGNWQAGASHYVGIAMPFGRLSADALLDLADLAARHRASELRLTPWRAILIVGLSAQAAGQLASELRAKNFILEADDPRFGVAACPGAPACRNATTSVQADAEQFRDFLPRLALEGIALHVSGCAKGCARSSHTPFTLVGNAGRYDLVLNGTAQDAPVVKGLSTDEAQRELKTRIEQYLGDRAVAKTV
jgi:precorrin-3B synthase